MKNIILRIAIFAICCISSGNTTYAQSLNGCTYRYTERVFGNNRMSEVTSYFSFTSSTEVIWLFETPDKYLFPVAIGNYNLKAHSIVFSNTHPLNKNTMLFNNNISVTFDFIIQSETLAKMTYKGNVETIKSLYNNGNSFIANKERYSLLPNTKMVATNWQTHWMVKQYGKEPYPQYEYAYFKSKYEVLLGGKSYLYVCIGNMVSLAPFSLASAAIGIYDAKNNTISFRKDGIYGYKGDKGIYTKIE